MVRPPQPRRARSKRAADLAHSLGEQAPTRKGKKAAAGAAGGAPAASSRKGAGGKFAKVRSVFYEVLSTLALC